MRFGGIYNVLSTSGGGSSSIQGESFSLEWKLVCKELVLGSKIQ